MSSPNITGCLNGLEEYILTERSNPMKGKSTMIIQLAKAELAALHKDATRYRWRKDNPHAVVQGFRGKFNVTVSHDGITNYICTPWVDSYDEAIDVAMSYSIKESV